MTIHFNLQLQYFFLTLNFESWWWQYLLWWWLVLAAATWAAKCISNDRDIPRCWSPSAYSSQHCTLLTTQHNYTFLHRPTGVSGPFMQTFTTSPIWFFPVFAKKMMAHSYLLCLQREEQPLCLWDIASASVFCHPEPGTKITRPKKWQMMKIDCLHQIER